MGNQINVAPFMQGSAGNRSFELRHDDDIVLDVEELHETFERIKRPMKEVFHGLYMSDSEQIDKNVDNTHIVFYRKRDSQESDAEIQAFKAEAVTAIKKNMFETTGKTAEIFELALANELLRDYITFAYLKSDLPLHSSAEDFLTDLALKRSITPPQRELILHCSEVLENMTPEEKAACRKNGCEYERKCKIIAANSCILDGTDPSFLESIIDNYEDLILDGLPGATFKIKNTGDQLELIPIVFIPIMENDKYITTCLGTSVSHEMTHVVESSILYVDDKKIVIKTGHSIFEYDLENNTVTGKYTMYNEIATEVIGKKAHKLLVEDDAVLIPKKQENQQGYYCRYSFCEDDVAPLYNTDNQQIVRSRIENNTGFIDLLGEENLQSINGTIIECTGQHVLAKATGLTTVPCDKVLAMHTDIRLTVENMISNAKTKTV